jgi:hypothetical protein
VEAVTFLDGLLLWAMVAALVFLLIELFQRRDRSWSKSQTLLWSALVLTMFACAAQAFAIAYRVEHLSTLALLAFIIATSAFNLMRVQRPDETRRKLLVAGLGTCLFAFVGGVIMYVSGH